MADQAQAAPTSGISVQHLPVRSGLFASRSAERQRHILLVRYGFDSGPCTGDLRQDFQHLGLRLAGNDQARLNRIRLQAQQLSGGGEPTRRFSRRVIPGRARWQRYRPVRRLDGRDDLRSRQAFTSVRAVPACPAQPWFSLRNTSSSPEGSGSNSSGASKGLCTATRSARRPKSPYASRSAAGSECPSRSSARRTSLGGMPSAGDRGADHEPANASTNFHTASRSVAAAPNARARSNLSRLSAIPRPYVPGKRRPRGGGRLGWSRCVPGWCGFGDDLPRGVQVR